VSGEVGERGKVVRGGEEQGLSTTKERKRILFEISKAFDGTKEPPKWVTLPLSFGSRRPDRTYEGPQRYMK
jgi:hypothetical protein